MPGRKIITLIVAALVTFSSPACERKDGPAASREPAIEAAPLGQEAEQWKIVTSDTVHLTVTAPGARQVKVVYKPTAAVSHRAESKTLTAPADNGGKFTTDFKTSPDFAGEVWAEVSYPDGTIKRTQVLSLATTEAVGSADGEIPADSIGKTAGTDESERSDKITGGHIERAALAGGDPRVWITVNLPAFRLTLWQNDREVRTYQVGIGRRSFPVPVGERKASEIVWNPEWVPPDSAWVLESGDVAPGERVEADDPRNPLGKVKVRLGQAILIHEAAKPSDIGHLVSHGCVRMLTEDIFDLTEKIVAARGLPVTKEQIGRVKTTTERMAVELDPPVWVDINYDTQVIEGGLLHLYPDVYDRNGNNFEKLRAELESGGINPPLFDDRTLGQMIERAGPDEEFVVSVADIKAGRALIAGRNQPLTDYSVERKPPGGDVKGGADDPGG